MTSIITSPREQLGEDAVAHQSIEIRDAHTSADNGCVSHDGQAKQLKKQHLRSLSEISRVHRERVAMRRRVLYSDTIRRELCVSAAKAVLYTLSVLLIFAGLCILCLGLYLRFFEDDGAVAPTLALWIVSFTALGLAFVASGSLVGLQRQRKCVTEGKRNYVLALFVALGLVGAVAAVTGGAMALVLERAVSTAQQLGSSSSSARDLETSLVANVIEYATGNSGGWRDMQSGLMCCGYANIQELSSLSAVKTSFVGDVVRANHLASGVYCSPSACAPVDADGSDSGSSDEASVAVGSSVCPVSGTSWCRNALLEKMEAHFKIVGVVGVSLGATQILQVLLSLFTLLRDVRTLRRRSPEVEIPRQPIAHIVGAPLTTSHDQKSDADADYQINPE